MRFTCQSKGLNKYGNVIDLLYQIPLIRTFDNSNLNEMLELPKHDDVKQDVLPPHYIWIRDAIIEVHRKLGLGVLQPTLEIFAMILFELIDNCTKIEIFESNGLYCSYEGEIE